jgi:hypothetical protein
MADKLCATQPAEHWDTGNNGNRLALLTCDACPATQCPPTNDPHPHGVIRAGTAYDDTGRPLPRCHCGYPNTSHRGPHRPGGCCRWCSPHTLPGLPRRFYDHLRHLRRHAADRPQEEAA